MATESKLTPREKAALAASLNDARLVERKASDVEAVKFLELARTERSDR